MITLFKKIKFPDSLKSIGRCAFEECGIEELILPEGFEEIKGGYSFAYTLNLKTISFPSTINKIDSQSFYFENEMSTDRLKSPSQICEIIWNNLSKDPTGTFSSSSFVVSANGGTIKSNTTHGYTSEQLLEYCKANFYAFKNNWDAA